jgi:hypothetical protein
MVPSWTTGGPVAGRSSRHRVSPGPRVERVQPVLAGRDVHRPVRDRRWRPRAAVEATPEQERPRERETDDAARARDVHPVAVRREDGRGDRPAAGITPEDTRLVAVGFRSNLGPVVVAAEGQRLRAVASHDRARDGGRIHPDSVRPPSAVGGVERPIEPVEAGLALVVAARLLQPHRVEHPIGHRDTHGAGRPRVRHARPPGHVRLGRTRRVGRVRRVPGVAPGLGPRARDIREPAVTPEDGESRTAAERHQCRRSGSEQSTTGHPAVRAPLHTPRVGVATLQLFEVKAHPFRGGMKPTR